MVNSGERMKLWSGRACSGLGTRNVLHLNMGGDYMSVHFTFIEINIYTELCM